MENSLRKYCMKYCMKYCKKKIEKTSRKYKLYSLQALNRVYNN